MNTEEYKMACNQSNVFPRCLLEDTERELVSRHKPSAIRLQEILKTPPVQKPELHNADKGTDYFLVTLNESEAEQIVEYLVDAEADAVANNGETTPKASRIASLVDAWVNYIDFCDASENKSV
jgi:hypothetical protein